MSAAASSSSEAAATGHAAAAAAATAARGAAGEKGEAGALQCLRSVSCCSLHLFICAKEKCGTCTPQLLLLLLLRLGVSGKV